MATGWARDGAVQDQIDATVKDGVKRAQSRIAQGPALTHCANCGAGIPEARRSAIPGVRLCVPCQENEDRDAGHFSGNVWLEGKTHQEYSPYSVIDMAVLDLRSQGSGMPLPDSLKTEPQFRDQLKPYWNFINHANATIRYCE